MDGIRLLGWWCTALSVAFVWPQVARVYRQHTVDGIAPKGTLHGGVASSMWLLYGLALGDAAISVANGAVVLAMALIATQQVRYGVLAKRTGVLTVLLVGVVGGVGLAISPSVVGWLAIVVGATSVLPQTVHVLHAPTLHGVSVPTYALLCLTTLSWASYGLGIGDPLVVATNLLVLPCAALVMSRTWVFQRRFPAPAALQPAGAL
jgi:uncharacterized protein with PQ loop repeat